MPFKKYITGHLSKYAAEQYLKTKVMKQYKARRTFMVDPESPYEVCNETAMDLVNIEDESDLIMCADDEFMEGEIVTENQIELKKASYVDDYGVGNAYFAFKKK